MNNFGLGIMCFGKEEYFVDTKIKLKELVKNNVSCYILTDNPNYFSDLNVNIVLYDRNIKSYHDKMLLIKHILKIHDICILLDADILVTDNSYINILKNYEFGNGITYIDTLGSHPANKMFIKQFGMNPENKDWYNYRKYIESVCSQYLDFETIYEYFLVVKKESITDNFYKIYEKLQVIKESCDILSYDKDIIGAGEGISLQISANVSNCEIRRDEKLYEILKSKIKNINRNR